MFETGVGIKNPLFFMGVVENNLDPRLEGRVQVRAFGVHGTNKQIPRDMLPWAIVAHGNYDPNNIPKINSWVFGVFLDGRDAQQPMVLSLIPTQFADPLDPDRNGWGWIPDRDGELLARGSDPESTGEPQQSRLLRGENIEATHVLQQESGRTLNVKTAGGTTWDEPGSAFNTQYPHNKVIETAYHSIELDDTPGGERITIHHKSGSYVQIDSRGTVTEKAVSDKFEVMDRKQHVVVGGSSTVTINGNSYVYVKGNKIEEIEGDLQQLVHGNHMLSVGGQSNINAGEQVQVRGADVKIHANVGTMAIKSGKELQFQSGQGTYFKSAKVWIHATDILNIKGNETFIEGTAGLDIFSDKVNIQGTSDFNIRGDAVLKVGSDGLLHLTGTTVNIDDNVNMANGAAAAAGSAFPAEDSIDAAEVVAPEPVAKSTSIVPSDEPGSMGTTGFSAQDHGGESGVSNGSTGSSASGTITAVTQSAVTPLLDYIGNKESNGYDDFWGGITNARDYPPKNLTQMTIQEVLNWQESIDRKYDSEAAGRYQIMEDTLRGYNNDRNTGPGNPLYTRAGLSASDLFSPENQDKLATALMNGRGLNRFLSGEITREQFANNLAAEWASLPLVTGPNAGKSVYEGDSAGNRAVGGAGSTEEEKRQARIQAFLAAIDAVKAKEQGIISGGAG